MTKEEYEKKIDQIERKAKEEKRNTAKEFALSNARYKEGDIIQDHSTIILVDRISWGFGFGFLMPDVIYYGIVLKKDLTPRKDGSIDSVYGANIEKKLN